jgi:uncharacterized membrane protein
MERAVDVAAALVMVWGVAIAVFGFIQASLRTEVSERILRLQVVRCDLGVKLVFALELLIVSDLLHTIVSRSMDDLLMLGVLVVIRTAIAFFLNKEIEEVGAKMSEKSGSGA